MNNEVPTTGATLAGSMNGHPQQVLVIAGDAVNAATISDHLDDHGFHVRARASFREGLRDLATRAPDLVILDLHLGRTEGLETLRAIRSQSNVPVIIITGTRDDELDRILSLELGADDCITTPFGPRELVARMHAVLRRRLIVCPAQGPDRGRYRFGGWG